MIDHTSITSDGPDPSEESLYLEIHRLVTACLEEADAGHAEELAELLAGSEPARDLYALYMHETCALRATGVSGDMEKVLADLQHDEFVERSATSRIPPTFLALGLAASLLAALTLWRPSPMGSTQVAQPGTSNPAEPASIATLTRTLGVEWSETSPSPLTLSRLSSGDALSFKGGQAELVFDQGIELLVTGPAEFVIVSPLKVVAERGAYTARVGKHGVGFTIDTPVTSVIDLGTEFGVSISDSGETNVAVFDGAVDLETNPSMAANSALDRLRLARGQAININRSGEYSRLVSVAPGEFPVAGVLPDSLAARQVLIGDVRDNIRDSSSMNFYRVVRGGLRDDAVAFVDRPHEWNGLNKQGLPHPLLGADYVMPFNNDKFASELELTVDLVAPCMLYVFLGDNMSVPDWLSRDFERSDMVLGLDEGPSIYRKHWENGVGPGESVDRTVTVWSRAVPEPCQMQLGSVQPPQDKQRGWNMYGIAATPLGREIKSGNGRTPATPSSL